MGSSEQSTSQSPARHVGIKREPRLYWVFLKSRGGGSAPEPAAGEGPHFTCRRGSPAQRPPTGLPARPTRRIAA